MIAMTLLLLGSVSVIVSTAEAENEENAAVEEQVNETEENDSQENESDTNEEQESEAQDNEEQESEEQEGGNQQSSEEGLIVEEDFEKVAENDKLLLKADPELGHFIVENKETGKVLRSFPNPDGMKGDDTAEPWKSHLQSPFMFTYVEFNIRKDVLKETSFLNQSGETEFKEIENGYRIEYSMPGLGFTIPIEVQLGEDHVETKVLADEIVDGLDQSEMDAEERLKDPKSRLVSLKAFPFLGAETSENEDGYLLLPDGPGALVEFQKNRGSTNNIYKERIYGEDMAFSTSTSFTGRQSVRMPVFGIKSENQTFLGIVREGDVYAEINAAASDTLTQYNWITAEHLFRYKFFQPTSRQTYDGFYTYSEEMERETRSIRYYLLQGEDPGYVDMATRYREYLIDEFGLSKLQEKEDISLQLNFLGGGTEQGFIRDSFLPMTTTDEATQIVKELNSSGVENMDIQYLGWQRGGFDKNGGHYPVAKKLGGNEGMQNFVDFAHKKGFSVYLDGSSYTFNNTNKDGFRPNRDGIQDLSSTVIEEFGFGGDNVLVSPRFMEKTVEKDFKHANELEVDGYLFGDGIGALLSTDYNDRHAATRQEALEIQQNIIQKTKEELGTSRVEKANFYSLENIDHIDSMESDYSFDLFVDRTVPFSQIAVHGLLTYSLEYENVSDNTDNMFLKGLEYGALPSYILTYGESHELVESRTLRRFYSTYYKDWEEDIASQYQHYNQALADVQHQFITDHQMIARGVYETTYEDGKRIYVNYNSYSYDHDDLVIEPESYAIREGGK